MRRSAPYAFGSLGARLPLATPGQRIGLLGGSFNPPHAAHRLITEIAIKRLGLDQVWWLVTPGNPLKANGGLPPLDARARLARQLAQRPDVVVTGFEKDLSSPYTAATLAHLRLRYPGVRFVWIMGGDCLAGFHRWQNWRGILSTMPVAVVDRPGWRLRAMASKAAQAFGARRIPEAMATTLPALSPPAWTYLTGPLSPLSSTIMRAARAREGVPFSRTSLEP